jgi:predicted RNA-binding protein with PIN domain
MNFIIDGNNLMHALGLAKRGMPQPQFERARLATLDWLAKGLKNRAVTFRVVFDAQHSTTPIMGFVHRGVRVQFSFQETADDVIARDVETEPKPLSLIVVSNDTGVTDAARRAQCHSLSCQEFMDWTLSPAKAAPFGEPEEPVPEKPEVNADEVNELLQVFSKPKPKT